MKKLKYDRGLLIVVLLALLQSGIWFAFFPRGTLQDRSQYNQLALNLLHKRGFSLDSEPPFEPTIFRVPTYPMFVASVYYIFGENNEDAVYLSQAVIFAIIVIIVFKIAFTISASRSVGLLAATIAALNPSLGSFTCELMAEILYTFLILGFVHLLIKALAGKRLLYYLLSGMILGVAALCRPTAQFIPLFLLLLLLVASLLGWGRGFFRDNRKRIAVGFLVLAAGASSLILPWVIRNKILFDKFTLATGIGIVLFNHTALLSSDRVFKGNILASVSESLATNYYPEFSRYKQWRVTADMLRKSVVGNPLASKICPPWDNKWHKGYNCIIIDEIWFNRSLEFVKRNPLRYVVKVVLSPVDSHSNMLIPQISHNKNITPVGKTFMLIPKLALFSMIVLCLFSFKYYRNNPIFLTLLALVCYNVFSIAPITSGARYVIVNYPIYAVMASLALSQLWPASRKRIQFLP